MKGLLYLWVLSERTYLIATAALFAGGSILGSIAAVIFKGNDIATDAVSMAAGAAILLTMTIASESLGRHLEKLLKCRFADYILGGAVSKNGLCCAELVKNLISTGAGLILGFIMAWIFSLAGVKDPTGGYAVQGIITCGLLFGVINWAIMPLVVSFKSAEKAGLTVGLLHGGILAVYCFTNAALNNGEANFGSAITGLLANKLFLPIFAGVIALFYAVMYFVFLSRLKRGDIC